MSREYVQDRLNNWGRWLLQSWAGGLGYPSTNILASMRGSSSSAADVVPINDVEARETHQAVQSLHLVRSNLWLAVVCRYVGDPQIKRQRRRPMSHAEIGAALNVTEQTSREWIKDAEVLIDAALTRAAVD